MEDTPPFPDPPAVTVERTLAIIKPDAIEQTEKIIEEIKRHGFTILQVSLHLLFVTCEECMHSKAHPLVSTVFIA